ncbi:MAG TPA: CBS domain-containing protein [Acidimicrobiia bacterium]|nr:CBS domain-containing protein [Acidimicrobiia bacterium]
MQLSTLVGGYVERIEGSTTLTEAARWMVSRKVGSLLVTQNGQLAGIFTEHDLTRAAAHGVDFTEATVDDWMSTYPKTAGADWTLDDAADVMVEEGIRHLPIVDDGGEVVGMLSIKDLVWAMRGPRVHTPEPAD